MRIASWNLNHRVGRTRFRQEAADAAIALDVDAIFFNEYFPQRHGPQFEGRLADAGWRRQLMSPEPQERANRVFVASRVDVERAELALPTFDHQLPANVLSVRFPGCGLRVLALRIPAYKAHQHDLTGRSWAWLESVADVIGSEAAVIIGDLNVPTLSTRGVGAETLRRIGALGWSMASSVTVASYFSPRGTTSTLDYLLHRPTVAVHRACFVTEVGGFILAGQPNALSDHAAIVADLDPRRQVGCAQAVAAGRPADHGLPSRGTLQKLPGS